MTTPLHLLPIDHIVAGHISGDFSMEETVRSCTDRIEEVNGLYNAVVWSDPTFIKGEIDRAQSQQQSGDDLPLLGVPILVKECDSAIEGIPNSWGNQHMKDIGYCDTYTSTSITLLRKAGAVIVGKTNNPEFALTITTESSAHGNCNNPLDVKRNAGGSSGGAAAAVASGMVNVATASDGGGSTRAPASNCGLFGFKPTRGTIPLGPKYEEAWDGLVCKGLIASNMNDLVRVLEVQAQRTFLSNLSVAPQHLRIGVRTDGFGSFYSVDPHVVAAVEKAAHFLSSQGHDVESAHPTSYDNTSFIQSFMDILAYNSVLDFRMLQQMVKHGMAIEACEEVTQWFYHEGLDVTESDHDNAIVAQRSFTDSVDEWFDDFDILITPTCGNVAPFHGEVQKDPDVIPFIYGGLCFPSNVAGTPAISIPIHTEHPSGLPVGLQIIAARGNDELALRLASLLERDYSDIQVTVPTNITS